MSFARLALLATSVAVAAASPALADTLTYPNAGTPATPVVLTATATGDIVGYFVGSDAGDTDTIGLYDLTTNTYSQPMMNNHTTTPGTAVDFGAVNAGDQLLFYMYNATTDTYLTSSTYNYDNIAHAWITNYAGGVIGGVTYPSGVYVGFEDLLTSQNSDLDYNDDTFVFTNVAASPVPEPGSLALMGTGVLSLAGVMRRRLKR